MFGEKEERSLTVWRNSDASESEKTLSAVGSLAEIASPLNECQPEMSTFKPTINGKGTRVIIQNSESQSTSGYSSPTHKTPDWSTTSSVSSSNHDIGGTTNITANIINNNNHLNVTNNNNNINKPMSYTIHNTKSTAVISLYAGESPKTKNVTLVNITGNTERLSSPIHSSTLLMNEYEFCTNFGVGNRDSTDSSVNKNETIDYNNVNSTIDEHTDVDRSDQSVQRRSSINSQHHWNVRSLLRKKKNVPKLGPELEGAIIKSESLAYLSEIELLARHQRNKDIHRVRRLGNSCVLE